MRFEGNTVLVTAAPQEIWREAFERPREEVASVRAAGRDGDALAAIPRVTPVTTDWNDAASIIALPLRTGPADAPCNITGFIGVSTILRRGSADRTLWVD